MEMEEEKCLVCNIKFENKIPHVNINSDSEHLNEDKVNEKLSFIYRKILRIFCTYFNLPQRGNDSGGGNEQENHDGSQTTNEQGILASFPFCLECRNLIAELCIFHEKLEWSQKLVQKTIAKITMKILNTEQGAENSNYSNSISISQQENEKEEEEEKENRNGLKYRQKIIQDFSPRVLLTKCQIPIQNQNQESNRIQETETETETDGLTKNTTNDNDENSSNAQDFHDNENELENHEGESKETDDADDDKSETDKIKKPRHESSQNEPDEKQNSVNKTPVPEKAERRQNLMEQIRSMRRVQNVLSETAKPASLSKSKSKSCTAVKNKVVHSREKVQKWKPFLEISPGKFKCGKWEFTKREEDGKFQCSTCSIRYKKKGSMTTHIRKKHGAIGLHEEVPSSSSFASYSRFKKRAKVGETQIVHTVGNSKWSVERTELGWKCGECPKVYKEPRKAAYHMELWHIPGNYLCPSCPRSFCRPSILRKHRCGFGVEKIQNKSTVEVSPGKFIYNGKWEFVKNPEGLFQCSVCSATRRKKPAMSSHMQSNHDTPDFQCEVCGRVFSTKQLCDDHTATHSATAEFKCKENDCDAAFNNRKMLRVHLRSKHNAPSLRPDREKWSKKFQCEKEGCPKTFVSLVYLKRHLKLHETPFGCPQPKCRDRFPTFEDMEIHWIKHKLANSSESDEEEVEENPENPNSTGQKSQRSTANRRKKRQPQELESESESESEEEEIESSAEEEHDQEAELTTEESSSESESKSEPGPENDEYILTQL